MKTGTAAWIALIALLAFANVASACPTCRDSVATPANASASAGDVAGGFNGAIYVLLAAALGGAGLVGGVLFLTAGPDRSDPRPEPLDPR